MIIHYSFFYVCDKSALEGTLLQCAYTKPTYFLKLSHGDGFEYVEIYKLSTLSLAHGVLRKNFRDDLIDGSLLKQLILIK